MCSTRILAQSEVGFINQCEHCQAIHLAFGTAIFCLSESEFLHICSQVQSDLDQIDISMNTQVKCIQIAHPSKSGFSFVLNITELRQLKTLLEPAQFLLTAYNLIRDDETLY